MLVTFMLPTRKRAKWFERSVHSLRQWCAHTDSFEVVVAVDTDDEETQMHAREFMTKEGINFQIIICERYGYKALSRYYNDISQVAKGDWLWLWNDDTTINTVGWDTILQSYTDELDMSKPQLGFIPTNNFPGNTFPLVNRAWIDALGKFSVLPANDTCVDYLAMCAGCRVHFPKLFAYHYVYACVADAEAHQIPKGEKNFILKNFLQMLRSDMFRDTANCLRTAWGKDPLVSYAQIESAIAPQSALVRRCS